MVAPYACPELTAPWQEVALIKHVAHSPQVYEGSEMLRVATMPGMWERTITIGSAGKSFSVILWGDTG